MKKKIRIDLGGCFEIIDFSCDICGNFAAVLSADNSGGEYTPNYLCLECIQKGFKKFEVKES